MTKERLTEKMKAAGMATLLVNRIASLMDEFATPDAFFAASRGDLQRRWHEKGNQRDLGDGFFEGFDQALAIWRAPDEDKYVPPSLRKFTKEDLKTIVDAMDLLSIPVMDAAQMGQLLDMRSGPGKEGKA